MYVHVETGVNLQCYSLGVGHLIYIETVDLELAALARLFRPGSPGNLLVSTSTVVL